MNAKKSFEEWLNEQGRPTEQESAQYKAAIESCYGTKWEWAQMQNDGMIAFHTSMYDLDGSHGTGGFVVSPEEQDYEKAKRQYGLSKPGDTYYVRKRLINGEWVTELEERPHENSQSGEAKSA